MGMTTIEIAFFVDTIKIHVTETTVTTLLEEDVTIREFAAGIPVSLEGILETGELICRKQNGDFIRGVEVEV